MCFGRHLWLLPPATNTWIGLGANVTRLDEALVNHQSDSVQHSFLDGLA